MPLIDTTQLALERAMQGSGLRQQALAGNLANANTPGYQRQDVDFHGTLAKALASADPAAALAEARVAAETDGTGAVSADGNGIDIDAESAKLAANGLEYQQLASAAHTRIEILRSAMGVGS